MKKRYAITMDHETHKLLTLKAVRSGQTVGSILDELVHQSNVYGKAEGWGQEATVDEVKKAIEPDQVKVQRPGKVDQPAKLSKGLGDIPGISRGDSFGQSRPAPKPGK